MKLNAHPEHSLYRQHQTLWPPCQQLVERWRAEDRPLYVSEYGLTWTYASAEAFVHQLADLFQSYNEVLWAQFPYCSACGGQCCVVGASDVRPFDLLAIALLGETPPSLPADITAGGRACVYLATSDGRPHCSWPSSWRTIKCWSFYCLGSGPWPAQDDLGGRYRALTAALHQLVETKLPEPLRRYEATTQIQLAAHLEDPVEFSNVFHTALEGILVSPLRNRFPELLPATLPAQNKAVAVNLFFLEDEVAEFVAESLTELSLIPSSPDNPDGDQQLNDDLETLAWIVENRPAGARRQLAALEQRYAIRLAQPYSQRIHAILLRLLAVWR